MPWTPPIGIPTPSWGALGNPIDLARPTLPSPWTSNQAGFYFVTTGGVNAGNGYPGSPRGTVPGTIPAGSVVVMHGSYTGDLTGVYAPGTEANPIWMMGYDTGNRPVLSNSKFSVANCSYLIVDNLTWDWFGSGNGKIEVAPSVNHIMWRNCLMSGVGSTTSTSGDGALNGGNIAFFQPTAYGQLEQIIFYNCVNTKGGNWLFETGDPDGHGLSMGEFVQDVWIVDNEFSYTSGCAIQIGAGTQGDDPDDVVCRRIYIGRNTGHHIAQTAFFTKRAKDIVFSQNTAHTLRRDCPSSPNSGGFGFQYGPQNTWFIYNTCYDCQTGIVSGANSLGIGRYGSDVYIIGNLLYDIHDTINLNENWRSDTYYTTGGVCIGMQGGQNVWVINNTFDDYDAAFMNATDSYANFIEGNIFSGRTNALGLEISIGSDNDSAKTFTVGGSSVCTAGGHMHYTGQPVYITTTGTIPSGLAINTLYYVSLINIAPGNQSYEFQLSTTQANAEAGTVITLDAGSGTHRIHRRGKPTFTAATDDTCTAVGHELITGQKVKCYTTGTMPANLTAGTDYYAIRLTSDTFKLATSRVNAVAGTEIDIDAGAGNHSIVMIGMSSLRNNIIEEYSGTCYARFASGAIYTTTATADAAKGFGNSNTAPTYVNAASRDYSLAVASNGIDDFGATTHPVYDLFESMYGINIELDRIGATRPWDSVGNTEVGASWDVGAYEYDAPISDAQAPASTGLPIISGTLQIHNTLSVTNGSWSGNPQPPTGTTYAYQWKRDGVSVGGATSNTYLLPGGAAEVTAAGHTYTCTVTATTVAGFASATSAATAAIAGVTPPTFSVSRHITPNSP